MSSNDEKAYWPVHFTMNTSTKVIPKYLNFDIFGSTGYKNILN